MPTDIRDDSVTAPITEIRLKYQTVRQSVAIRNCKKRKQQQMAQHR